MVVDENGYYIQNKWERKNTFKQKLLNDSMMRARASFGDSSFENLNTSSHPDQSMTYDKSFDKTRLDSATDTRISEAQPNKPLLTSVTTELENITRITQDSFDGGIIRLQKVSYPEASNAISNNNNNNNTIITSSL